jgi:nucleotide-binding universal stress UspA family protein
MTMIRRILHASDFSPASAPALARAIELAKASRAELRLLHVLDPLAPMPDGYVTPPTYAALRKSAQAYGRKQLERLVAKATKAGVRATALLREGTPWSEILRASRSPKADVIVIGTHGRTGLSRLLLGSVASRVIGLARCPVLSVGARLRKGG